MSSRFICVVATHGIFFIRVHTIPLYAFIPHFLYYLCTNGHLGCFYLLAAVNDATVNTDMHIPVKILFPFSGDILLSRISGSNDEMVTHFFFFLS